MKDYFWMFVRAWYAANIVEDKNSEAQATGKRFFSAAVRLKNLLVCLYRETLENLFGIVTGLR